MDAAYNQASSTSHSFLELQHPMAEQINSGLSDTYYPMTFSSKHCKLFLKLLLFPSFK